MHKRFSVQIDALERELQGGSSSLAQPVPSGQNQKASPQGEGTPAISLHPEHRKEGRKQRQQQQPQQPQQQPQELRQQGEGSEAAPSQKRARLGQQQVWPRHKCMHEYKHANTLIHIYGVYCTQTKLCVYHALCTYA
jgi:hypothetical protein